MLERENPQSRFSIRQEEGGITITGFKHEGEALFFIYSSFLTEEVLRKALEEDAHKKGIPPEVLDRELEEGASCYLPLFNLFMKALVDDIDTIELAKDEARRVGVEWSVVERI